MYVIDYYTFIKQSLPPHWHGQWQHHLIDTLCYPLKQVFDDIYALRDQAIEDLNHNSQVENLEEKLQTYHKQTEVGVLSRNGTINILAPDNSEVSTQIEKHLTKVKTAGKSIQFLTQLNNPDDVH